MPHPRKKITPTPNYVYNTTVVVRTFLESRSYRWLTKLDGKVNISIQPTMNHSSSLEVVLPSLPAATAALHFEDLSLST